MEPYRGQLQGWWNLTEASSRVEGALNLTEASSKDDGTLPRLDPGWREPNRGQLRGGGNLTEASSRVEGSLPRLAPGWRDPYRGQLQGCLDIVLVLLDLLPEAHRLVVLQRVDILHRKYHRLECHTLLIITNVSWRRFVMERFVVTASCFVQGRLREWQLVSIFTVNMLKNRTDNDPLGVCHKIFNNHLDQGHCR